MELAAEVTDRSSPLPSPLVPATASLLGKLRLELSRDPEACNGDDGEVDAWRFGLWVRRFLPRELTTRMISPSWLRGGRGGSGSGMGIFGCDLF